MSLPTSHSTPDAAPPSENRPRLRLREALEKAESPAFLEYQRALKSSSLPDLDFFVALILSALAFYLAVVLNQPSILFIAAISAPFLRPMAGLAAAAALPSLSHFLLSLLGLAVSFAVYISGGWLAGLTQSKSLSHPSVPLTYLLRSTWLEWALLIGAALLMGYFFARLDERYRMASAGLAYLVFLPAGLIGYLMQVMPDQSWLAALVIVLARLFASAFGVLAGMWVAGLSPRQTTGILIAVVLALLLVGAAGVYAGSRFSLIALDPLPSEATTPPPTPILPAAYATSTPITPLRTSTPAATLRPTQLPPTATPVPIRALVSAPEGIIVRELPDTTAPVVTYLNNRDQVDMLGEDQLIGSIVWQKIQTADGKIGWVMGRLVVTPQPPKP